VNRAKLQRTLGLATGLAVVSLVSCLNDSVGPGARLLGRLAVAPVFDSRALLLVDFDRIRIRLLRPGTEEVVIDTVVAFASDADSVAISLQVPVQGSAETFSLSLAMVNAAGDTVFRGGPVDVTAAPGVLTTAPAQPTIRYTGTGSNAASVRFVTAPSRVYFDDTVSFVAEALDSAGAVIPSTPIVYSVSDTTRARVPDPGVGRVVARQVRGSVQVRAALLTPPSATTSLAVQPRPSVLAVSAGNAQTGTVGAALAQPITAVVTAADGLGVEGITVSFAVATGGGTLSAASAVTDSAGKAAVTWTMGTTAGAQSATATATGLTPASVTFTATAAPGAAKTLVFTQAPPESVAAGAPFGVTVAARDTFGNAATGFTGTVNLVLGANPGAATLSGAGSVAAVAGVATYAAVSLDVAASGYTLVASSAGLPSITSAAIGVSAGAPARLTFATSPSDVVAGAVMAPAVVVAIRDASGNVVPTATDSVTVAIAAGPTGATLLGTTRVQAVAGQATFADLRLPMAGSGYRLVPVVASLQRDTSAAFVVTPAPASLLAFAQQPTDATAGAAIAPAVQVAVRDSLGNVATGYAGAVTITLATSPTGDTLRGVRTATAAAGVATFDGLSLVRAGAGYRLGAAAVGVAGGATSGTFDVAPAAPARLGFVQQPSLVSVADTVRPPVGVGAFDAFGNATPSFTGGVTVALGNNPGGATLGGTTAVAAVSGLATFSILTLDRSGVGYTLVASASGLDPDTSAAFEVRATTPTQLVFLVEPSNVVAGAAIAPAVQVALRDALGNTITTATDSVLVAIGTNPGSGTLGGTLRVAPVNGVATFGDLTIDKTGSLYTLAASAGALPVAGSAAFDVTPAAVASLAFEPMPGLTQTAGTPIPITIVARDGYGNLATNFAGEVTLSLAAGPGATLEGTLTVNAVGGVATFPDAHIDLAGLGYTIRATAGAVWVDNVTFEVMAAPASAMSLASGDAQTGTVNTALAQPFVVTVRDSLSNAVSGTSVTFRVVAGGGKFGGADTAAAATDAAGQASATLTLGPTAGANAVTAEHAGLAGSPVTFTATGMAGPATQIAVSAGDGQSATVGTAVAAPPSVLVTDALGNPVSGVSVTFAVTAGGGSGAGLSATTNASGIAAVGSWTLGTAVGANTLTATATGLSGSPVTFTATATAGAASVLVFTTEPPSSRTAGVPFAPVVTAQDALGNVATGFSGVVSLAFGVNAGSGTLRGSLDVAAGSGVATFTGISVDRVGSGYTLTASATGLTGDTSAAFTIVSAPASALVFSVEPPSAQVAGTPFAVEVTARDSMGNTAGDFTGSVAVAIGTNPAGGTLSGTAMLDAVAGVASFTDLAIDNIGSGYTLAATSSGLSGATSGAFDITAPAGVNAWVNTADGNWSVAGNWSKNAVPTATDTVEIRQSGTYTVTLDVAATVNMLTVGGLSGTQTLAIAGPTLTVDTMASFTPRGALLMTGGTLAGAGPVIVAGSMSWQGGTITGAHSVAVLPGATLDISGPATRTLSGQAVLDLAGTGTWSGAHTLQTGNGSVLLVSSGATLDVTGDVYATNNQGTSPSVSRIVNLGTINRTTSAGTASINVPLDNNGTVNVATGTLNLGNYGYTGTSSGSFVVASGAVLQVSNGTSDLAGTASVSGAGTFLASGGTTNVAGTLTVDSVSVAGGTLNYNNTGGSASVANVAVSGGTLGGAGVLQATETFGWTGGYLSTGSGTGMTQVTGVATIGGAATRTLVSRYTLELAGTGPHTWTDGHTLQTGNGSVFRVASGATLNVTGDVSLTNNQGTSPSVSRVVNLGTINRTTSAGVVSINAPFDNDGTVNVTTGTLNLGNYGYTGTSNGPFVVGAGAVLQVSNGTSDLTGTASIGGAGTFLASGGTTNVAGPLTVDSVSVAGGTLNYNNTGGSASVANVAVTSGALGGAGVLQATETFGWTGGYLSTGSGTGMTQVTGVATINGTATRTLVSRYTLELAGTGPHTWTDAHTLQTGNGSVFRVASGATLNVTGDVSLTNNQGTSPSVSRVVNLGTINRTTSAGVVSVNAPLDNDGAVNVATGTLNLGNYGLTGTGNGSFVVALGAVLQVSNGISDLTGTASISGAGTLLVSGGTTNLGGTLAIDSVSVSGGTLNYNNTGATATVARVSVSGGTLGGVGVLQVPGTFGWTGGALSTGSGTGMTQVTGVATINGTATRNLVSRYTLDLAGPGPHTWADAHTVQAGNGSVFRVASGATLNVTGNVYLNNNQGVTPSAARLVNYGTITRSGALATDVATINAVFVDSGSTTVASGILDITQYGQSGIHAGSVAIGSGAALRYSNGTTTLTTSSTVMGMGELHVTGGAVSLQGAYSLIGALRDSSGSFTFDQGTPTGATDIQIVGGTFGGTGTVTASGTVQWLGGTLSGSGSLTVATGGTLDIAGSAGKIITNGYRLENAGTGYWRAGNTIGSGFGAVVANASGGTLHLMSDVSAITWNQGGAAPEFRNLGTLVRDSSAGTFGVNVSAAASYMTGPIQVLTGALSFTRDGALNGNTTIASGAYLDLSPSATLTLRPAFLPTGQGAVRITSGTVTVDSGATLTLHRLVLAGGSFSHKGHVVVDSTFLWTGGSLRSSSLAGRGTTTVDSGATMTVDGASALTLQTHTLEVLDTSFVDGTYPINMSDSAVIYVGGGAMLDAMGTGGILNSSGGPAVNNQGVLRRSTSSASFTINVPVTSAGAINHVAGGFRLTGGGSLSGTASTVGGDSLVLAGSSTFTLGGAMSVTGSLSVEGGVLDLNGNKLDVSGRFRTASTGQLRMVSAADSLLVTGNLFFGGGSTTGLLTDGIIRATGDFAQTGPTTTAFAPSGNHRVEFNSGARQTVLFDNPGAALSRFQRLQVVGQAGMGRDTVELLGNTYVLDSLAVRYRSEIRSASPNRLVVGGNVVVGYSIADTPAVRPFVLEVAGTIVDSTFGRIQPDTLVLSRTGTYGITDLPYLHLRVNAGTVTLPFSNVFGDVEVSAGSLSIPSGTHIVAGNFRTTGSGTLQMQTPSSFVVQGDATFAGGNTAGLLTAGTLELRGNFVQSGASGGQFAPSGAHWAVFNRIAAGTQTVQFQDSVNSFFWNLVADRSTADTVRLLSNVLVADSAIVTGSSVLASTTNEALKLPATGAIRVLSGAGELKTRRAEFGTLYADSGSIGAGRIAPDTAVFLNGGSFPSDPVFQWRSVRVAGGTLTSSSMTSRVINGDLVISGGAYLAGSYAVDSVAGALRTEGGGRLMMTGMPAPTLAVRDSVLFAGGISDSLSAGTLRLYGNFRQVYGTVNGATFQARPSHMTVFSGLPSANQTITFETPGITGTDSRFGMLRLARSDTIMTAQPVAVTLGSSFVADMLSDTSSGAADTLKSPTGTVISLGGFGLNSTVFDSVKVVVMVGMNPLSGDGITFLRMPRSWYQLEINRPDSAATILNNVNFFPLSGMDTGVYFGAYRSSGTGNYTLTFTSSSPASLGGRYLRGSGTTVYWNSETPLP